MSKVSVPGQSCEDSAHRPLMRKSASPPNRLVLWGGILLSAGIGMLCFMATSNSIENEVSERFEILAHTSQNNISTQIKAYTEVLRGTASFLHTAGPVTRAQFQRYVSGLNLAANLPAIDSINFATYILDEDRSAFEAAIRQGAHTAQDGYPELAIQPPGRRPEYTVLTLIEPAGPWSEKTGLDIGTKPHVAAMLAASRDSGAMNTSGQLFDLTAAPSNAGLGMRLPIYNNKMPVSTAAERHAAYIGSVGMSFDLATLIQDALDDIAIRDARLILYDGGTLSAPNDGQSGSVLLFDSSGRGAAPSSEHSEKNFSLMLPIHFSGRLWQANFQAPKHELYSRLDRYLPWLALTAGFGGSMLIFLLFYTLASARLRAIHMAAAMTRELRDSQARLQSSHATLRRLAAHADQIKEGERKRIAREIHDDLGQNLLALRIEADLLTVATKERHPRLNARARLTLAQIDATIKSVRHIINDLRPAVLDLGLSAAVQWQIAQFRQRSGMACELIEPPGDISMDEHCATAFFRILQESLSNIARHAKASSVRVELRQQGGMLTMTVSDNGVGLLDHSRNKAGSFGLVGIEERITILGGQCSISGSPAAGTTVTVSVPLGPAVPEEQPGHVKQAGATVN